MYNKNTTSADDGDDVYGGGGDDEEKWKPNGKKTSRIPKKGEKNKNCWLETETNAQNYPKTHPYFRVRENDLKFHSPPTPATTIFSLFYSILFSLFNH